MTKVKVKGSFLSKPTERGRFPSDDHPAHDEYGQSPYLPFVGANSKGKRGPRGTARPPHRDSSGPQSDDSALGTSSSRGSFDEDDDVGDSGHHQVEERREGFGNAPVDSARRGIRVKVKPSKFRESLPPQSRNPFEGRSPLKKKQEGSSFDPGGFRQAFHAREYAFQDRREHSTNELGTALMVVRKIMKMDAAEPFNIPVDPVALGIPDYFDIVKRPMDLGTICKNLERGGKYRSSRDVYEDVQLVWTNCRIYNQKGDPILDLLARVKKNFMKYWTAAGLYTEKSPDNFKFGGGSSEAEITGSSFKQKEVQEEMNHSRTKKSNKFSSVEQGVGESKPSKAHFSENCSEYRKDQEGSATANDELDVYYSNREGPKVISVYKTHKKKLLEQQGNEHPKEVGLKAYEQEEQKSGGRGLILLKHPPLPAEKTIKQKESEPHGTSGKSRRVSGTGHHKADCSCVVCTGVRRKLAREGKLPAHLVNASGSAESPVAQERIVVRLKAEGSSDRQKSHHGSGSSHRIKEGKRKADGEELTKFVSMKKAKLDDSEVLSMDADSEKLSERDDDSKAYIKEEGKAYAESEGRLYPVKAGSEDELKGPGGEEADDRDDGVQTDEQLADMLETERQEGGVKYYRASYEMPLRKINPSILQVGHKLFGIGSRWSHGHSLSRRSSKTVSENPVYAAISQLLSSKVA